ncbi:hypothetical protein CY34DRAFT_802913 [Suillus luteus UH-Slu-Lm8-n1]|uniref:Uncharacterized protein n=1 Tax=Suillus luteus UH-Slu-Lm8-n1 TaxID=930992 RepID=A0A0D0A2J4_9AGAM|nr:hypothetical protein CY34DRAFT_802913 [Suillus luteus UH-Slu-Lm8-n1]
MKHTTTFTSMLVDIAIGSTKTSSHLTAQLGIGWYDSGWTCDITLCNHQKSLQSRKLTGNIQYYARSQFPHQTSCSETFGRT